MQVFFYVSIFVYCLCLVPTTTVRKIYIAHNSYPLCMHACGCVSLLAPYVTCVVTLVIAYLYICTSSTKTSASVSVTCVVPLVIVY